MAQLKDSLITGSLRVTDTTYTNDLIISNTTAPTIATNDYLLLADASDSNKILKGPALNTSNTTKWLTQAGSWTTPTAANVGAAPSAGANTIVTVGTVTTGTWSATAINPNKGGTGVTSYAKGDILYAGSAIAATATTALSKLALGTAGYTLQATANGPAWTQKVAVANGGTNATSVTKFGIAYGNSSADAYTFTSAGSDGYILIGKGASTAPTWQEILPISHGGTGTKTAPTQWGVIYASATTSYASTSAGTAGYLLQSNATSAPSWIQATDANTASTIVKRDASGNFSAGTITAALSGNASTAATWQTSRTLTVGATGKSVNGSADVSWSMNEIMGSSDSSKFYRGDKTWSNILTGGLNLNGDLHLYTSSTDSPDIVWWYANKGQEQARIWMGDGGTTVWAPYYRCYNPSGTQLYSGNLVLGDGTGASGTWGISITGNAATVSRATFGDSSNGEHNANNITSNGLYYYTSNGPSDQLGARSTDGSIYCQAFSTYWVSQIAQDYRDGGLYVRGKNNSTWQKWLQVMLVDLNSTAITNCNSVYRTGIYTYGGFTNRPSDVSDWGTLANYKLYESNNNFHRQIFYDCYATDRIWTRSCDSGSWTSWKELVISGTAHGLSEGTSDWTDNTEILTSYASNNGFSDSNAKGVIFRRDAICAYNYIKSKASGSWGINITGSSGSCTGNAATATKATQDGSGNTITSTYLKKTDDEFTGRLVIAGKSNGASSITYDLDAIVICPPGTRTKTAGTYFPGIAFNHMTHYNNGTGYQSSPQAWIGLKIYDTSGSERSYLVFATKSDTANTGRPVERMTIDPSGTVRASAIYGAVWNDYAEFRSGTISYGGYCVHESLDGTLRPSETRLEAGCRVTSDTYGFAIGETNNAKTPIAVSGRVLVYPYRNKSEYKLGTAVCSAPGGTIDIMTRDEIMMYPERIVGTVSEIPDYEIWHGGAANSPQDIKVNGRIWIYVR